MSLISRCAQCDARVDLYGRDGGHSWCNACREEEAAKHSEHEAKAPERKAA